MKKAAVIAPSFPPALDAVGAFAEKVSKLLKDEFSLSFIDSSKRGAGFSEALKDASVIFLHYVGYGFEKRGCPFWLLRELRDKKAKQGVKIITYFHELFAEGSFLSSAFYLAPLQKNICRELIKLSDHSIYTSSLFFKAGTDLFPWSIKTSRILPISSTIGEPESVPEFTERKRCAVVFGTRGRRDAVYKSKNAERILKELKVDEVLDIGPSYPSVPSEWMGIKVTSLGPLPPDKISDLLLDTKIGLIEYPAHVLGKSSIFAAYASHGVCPLVIRPGSNSQDGLLPNINYLAPESAAKGANCIGLNAFSWYRSHTISSHSKLLKDLLAVPRDEDSKKRVLFVFSQRTQNEAPLRYLSESKKIDVVSAFLSGDKEASHSGGDEHINIKVTGSIEDSFFQNVNLRNISPNPSLAKRAGLINPSVISLVKEADKVVAFGHFFISFWITIFSAVIFRKPLYLTNDAIAGGWKRGFFLKFLYRFVASGVFVPSSLAKEYLKSLGVKGERIFITPYAVDEDQFLRALSSAEDGKIRKLYSIGSEAKIVLFCGKLIPRKGASHLLKAFSKLPKHLSALLLIVGDGPLRSRLESEALSLGISDRVRFVGLIPYKDLPAFYKDADIYVHPAIDEPWGLPINEAILSKTPVVASSSVGAAHDLIKDGVSGRKFKSSDIESLTECIKDCLVNGDSYAANAALNSTGWTSKRASEVFEEALR